MVALLIIIYISFISLGLPDSLLGSAWPIMQNDLATPFSIAGYINMTVQAGTIVSSLFSNRLISKFGTAKVTIVSVMMTAIALFGYSFSPNVYFLFIAAIPMGLGAGSVDAALNNFVALHFKSKHMSWLHCFWGIGATIGPAIMSITLMNQGGWRTGYLTIGIIQSILVVALFFTLPLWKRVKNKEVSHDKETSVISNRQALKIPLVKLALISFIFFSATEATTGLWSGTFLVMNKGLSATEAARAVSVFYGAITVGRLISGFASMKMKSHVIIRIGQIICILGAVSIILPLHTVFSIIGVILIGLGTAPVFPSMLHETPYRFGTAVSQAIMGLQMAFAYIGSTLCPPLFGSLATVIDINIFPYFILICVLIMFIASEILQKKLCIKNRANKVNT